MFRRFHKDKPFLSTSGCSGVRLAKDFISLLLTFKIASFLAFYLLLKRHHKLVYLNIFDTFLWAGVLHILIICFLSQAEVFWTHLVGDVAFFLSTARALRPQASFALFLPHMWTNYCLKGSFLSPQRLLLYSEGRPWTHVPPDSASIVPTLQMRSFSSLLDFPIWVRKLLDRLCWCFSTSADRAGRHPPAPSLPQGCCQFLSKNRIFTWTL